MPIAAEVRDQLTVPTATGPTSRAPSRIYCLEIEERLLQHPAIADADLEQWVADGPANSEVPAPAEVRTDELPCNASGKLLENVRGEGVVSPGETM